MSEMVGDMGRLEFSTPRKAWGGEAAAFTPLLGQDDILEYLGEAVGVGPLTVVESNTPPPDSEVWTSSPRPPMGDV